VIVKCQRKLLVNVGCTALIRFLADRHQARDNGIPPVVVGA
jgi:hypothetical protein